MIYRFEDFALDTGRRELNRGHQRLSVEPKVFDLLVHLISHRDRVVGKDELIAAIWNARIVSDSALTTCINAARSALGDSGGAQRLIKTLPRKGIRFVGGVTEEASKVASTVQQPAAAAAPAPALPDRPSMAVLPFTSMSADPEQEYFSDGVAEEIITALSQMRWLFVISRNSSFTYKGREVDVQTVGRELGVRYVLAGSVRKSAKRVRIAAHLSDARTRENIWADQFEGPLDDIFDLQDRIARRVIGSVIPRLEDAEIERSKRKLTENLNAYDYYLRALTGLHQRASLETNQDALLSARKAIALDLDFASAYGLAAFCYTQRQAYGWLTDRGRDVPETKRLALQAAHLGKNDANALAWAGQSLVYVGHEIESGADLIDRALVLNPNSTSAWHWSAWVKIWTGDPDGGVERAFHAMRLSPLDPFMPLMQYTVAHGHFFASRHTEAAAWAAKSLSVKEAHSGLRISAASNAFAGDLQKATSAIDRLRQIDPNLRVSNLANVLGPYQRPDYLAKYQEGLRRAGLPE